MKKIALLLACLLLLVLLYWFGGIVFEAFGHLSRALTSIVGSELVAVGLLAVGYCAGMLLITSCSKWQMLSGRWASIILTGALGVYLLPFLAIIVRLIFSLDATICEYGSGRYCE